MGRSIFQCERNGSVTSRKEFGCTGLGGGCNNSILDGTEDSGGQARSATQCCA
jgi:hypothetical protein